MRKGKKKDDDDDEDHEVKEGYGYIRVSTEQQKDQGVSLTDQEVRIQKYADYKGIKLLYIYKDKGLSGKTIKKRPELVKLLDVIQKGQALITWSLSRLSRSTADALNMYEKFKNKKITLICLKEDFNTSTAGGRLFFRIMAAVNEFESEVIQERTKDSMARLEPLDRAVGKPCYGWKKKTAEKGSGLIENEEQQHVIRLMIRKKEEEKKTDYQIAKELNESGIKPPKNAKEWYPKTIHDIIDRAFDVRTKGRDEFEHGKKSKIEDESKE